MNIKLTAELTEMDDVTFFLLEHHFYYARLIRDTMKKDGLGENDMAAILEVAPKQMKSVLNGSYEFDLRLISKLQAYREKKAAADVKLKVEAESLQFATYKDQYPLYVHRIERLLEILEAKNKVE